MSMLSLAANEGLEGGLDDFMAVSSSALWHEDDDAANGASGTHHLVPARLVRVAHRLRQIDESDDRSTISALSRMKLPQMTGQIRDVEQRALEIQRDEGREEFRIKALHHNLVHHTIPSSIATIKAEALPPPPSFQPSVASTHHGLAPILAGCQPATSSSTDGALVPMAAGGGSGDGDAMDEAMDEDFDEDDSFGGGGGGGGGASGGVRGCGGGGSGFPLSAPACGDDAELRAALISAQGGGGASAGGASSAHTCVHGTSAMAYFGLSHTATAAAARASFSLSDSLSQGASASVHRILAQGNPCCGGGAGGGGGGMSSSTISIGVGGGGGHGRGGGGGFGDLTGGLGAPVLRGGGVRVHGSGGGGGGGVSCSIGTMGSCSSASLQAAPPEQPPPQQQQRRAGDGQQSTFKVRTVNADQLSAMREAAMGLSTGTSTTITVRGSLVEPTGLTRPIDMRPGAPDHALWYAPG